VCEDELVEKSLNGFGNLGLTSGDLIDAGLIDAEKKVERLKKFERCAN